MTLNRAGKTKSENALSQKVHKNKQNKKTEKDIDQSCCIYSVFTSDFMSNPESSVSSFIQTKLYGQIIIFHQSK